jgi:hypothetical protein
MHKIVYYTALIFIVGCSDYKIHNLNDDATSPSTPIVDSADPTPDPEIEPDPILDPEPEEDTAVVEEPDPDPPPEYPDIEVSHNAIDFGNLNALGDVGVEVVSVKNVGDADLNVSDLRLNLGSAVYALTPIGSTIISPGSYSTFSVEYDPVTYEINSDSVTIESNDPDESVVTIPITGNGSAPVIDLDPVYYDFGTTHIGCDEAMDVRVSNIGDIDLVVSDLRFFVTYPTELSVDQNEEINGLLPWIISPGDSKNVTIYHIPFDELSDTSFLEVDSNDPLSPIVTADQIAEGDFIRDIIDEFEQDEVTSADILFVIDNSGSMGVWQTALTDNFNSFISVFAVTGVDYQIAVITTDSPDFRGPILTDATIDLETEFTVQAIAGTYGSAMEKGLHYAELTTLTGGDAEPGSDFLREDAKLIIIFVSDEKDWSSKTDTEYEAHFKSLKASDSMVVTHAVVGDSPSGCSSTTSSWARADYGEGYIEVSALTGGEFVSICSSDWGTDLETLAHDSILQRSFDLTETPYEDTIVVEVDGIEMTGWTYNTSENTVEFLGSYVPDSGTEVDISYSVLADCDSSDTGA